MDRAVFDRMQAIDATHWWFAGRRAIVTALLERFAPRRAGRVLEIGCGTGSNLAMLSRYGTLDAVEPDGPARAIAAARSGIAVKGGYMPHGVDLADGAYDLIVLLDVLEHIDDDAGTLALLRAKLAQGGRLVMTVPSAPWMWSAHDVAHHHHRRYTWRQMQALLERSGFRVRHRAHFNSLLYTPIALARLIGRLRGKDGGDDALPPAPVNRLLGWLFAIERLWVPRVAVPLGVSLAVVAEAT